MTVVLAHLFKLVSFFPFPLIFAVFYLFIVRPILSHMRDPFVESETGSSFGFSETACFTSETETGFANLVKPSSITVSLSKRRNRKMADSEKSETDVVFYRV